MDAAWAQAYLSGAAIVVSGALAVFVPFMERRIIGRRADRARLNVTTTRSAPNGLKLEIRYVPEFTHAAITARIAEKSPGVRLMLGRPVLNPAPMASGGYVRYEFDGEALGGESLIGLTSVDDSGALTGVVFLLPDGTSEWVLKNARIEATISDAGGDHLLTRALFVSPIEEGPRTMFVEPVPIRSVLRG